MASYLVNYLLNFAFVFGCMILFTFPFAAYFYWQHRQSIREKKPGFNQFMERFFQSRSSNWLVFTWAFGEAIVWFIIPEFLLFLVIFMRIKRKRELLIYDIAGTVAGTIVGLFVHMSATTLISVPYIFPGMIHIVTHWYQQLGIWGLIYQPFSGVPYKVFIALAPDFGVSILLFIVIAVLMRLFRYFVIYGLFIVVDPLINMFVRRNYKWLLPLGIAVFTVMLMRISALYS